MRDRKFGGAEGIRTRRQVGDLLPAPVSQQDEALVNAEAGPALAGAALFHFLYPSVSLVRPAQLITSMAC